MKINEVWLHYGSNTQIVSWVARVYTILIILVCSFSHSANIIINWQVLKWFLVLDIIQYLYLVVYYEVKGQIFERYNIDIGHYYIYLVPAVLCFYGKVLLLLWVIL